jgi:hypothetical protein
MKPMVPGAIPAAPATTVVAPPPPGNVPLKPVVSTPASTFEAGSKTGTSIVKTAPPKQTARITVKPNLPATAVRAGGNFPIAKATVAGAVPVVAAAAAGAAVAVKAVAKPVAASKPATTIVKTGVPTARAATVKPVSGTVAPVAPAVAVAAVATSTQFQDEGSTTLTTVLAGVLALLTWGTAGVLIASYLAWI